MIIRALILRNQKNFMQKLQATLSSFLEPQIYSNKTRHEMDQKIVLLEQNRIKNDEREKLRQEQARKEKVNPSSCSCQ
jgi:hypothetical protein